MPGSGDWAWAGRLFAGPDRSLGGARWLALGVACVMMVQTAEAEMLPSDSLALAPEAAARLPKDAAPARLIAAAEGVLTAQKDGAMAAPGVYSVEPLVSMLAATLALERAAAAGAAVDGALAEAYYDLYAMWVQLAGAFALADVGTPLPGLVDAAQKERAEAYVKTLEALPAHCEKRLKAVSDKASTDKAGTDKAGTDKASTVRAAQYRAKFHFLRLEPAEMEAFAAKVAAADPDDTDAAFEVAVAQSLQAKDEGAAKKILAAAIDGDLGFRIRASRTLALREGLRTYRAAQKTLAKEPGVAHEVAALTALSGLYPKASFFTYRAIRAAEERFPNSGDIKLHRAAWLMGASLLDATNALLELIETGSLEVTLDESKGRRLAARMAQLSGAAATGDMKELRRVVEATQRDGVDFKGADAYPRDMALVYMDVVSKVLSDQTIMKALRSEAGISDPDARRRILRIAEASLQTVIRRYRDRADLWRLKVALDVLSEPEAAVKRLEKTLKAMDKAVRKEDRSDAGLFAGFALMLAGRQPGEEKRLWAAEARFEGLRQAARRYRNRLLNDKSLSLPLCPDMDCVDTGALYSYLGATRNMLSVHLGKTGGDRPAWDKTTIQLMREGERVLRAQGAARTSAHAQVMGHRCWVQVISGAKEAAVQCLTDVWAQHRSELGIQALYASAVAQSGQNDDAMAAFQRLATSDAPAAVRYDAEKWLGTWELGRGHEEKAKEHLTAAVALRDKVTRLGASLEWAFMAVDGNFNIGVGVDMAGHPAHSVSLGADLWSLLIAPVADDRIDAFLKQ